MNIFSVAFKSKQYAMALGLYMLFAAFTAQAQFMPVVFDKTYGRTDNFNVSTPLKNGNFFVATESDKGVRVVWLSPIGETVNTFVISDGFSHIEKAMQHPQSGDIFLIGGGDFVSSKKIDGRARIMRFSQDGKLLYSTKLGNPSARLTQLSVLPNGDAWVGGYNVDGESKQALTAKILADGKVGGVQEYKPNLYCNSIIAQEDGCLVASFSSNQGDGLVVKRSSSGVLIFETWIKGAGTQISRLVKDNTNSLLLIAQNAEGVRLIKLRPEGDVVFDKMVKQAGGAVSGLLVVNPTTGEALVAASSDDSSNLIKFRNDGTELFRKEYKAQITALELTSKQEAVIACYNDKDANGFISKVGFGGISLFEKTVRDKYTSIKVDKNGDIYYGGPESARLTLVSEQGNVLFDKIVTQDIATFKNIEFQVNGDVVFLGKGNRILKLGHGLIVSDIKVMEPLSGHAMASFTVTLTGFQLQEGGAPLPVSVSYNVKTDSASDSDVVAVNGILSFVPNNDENSGGYLVKQIVEVPIKADDILEGIETFTLNLANVENSYLIKAEGKGTVEDQPALVRFINSKEGVEAGENLRYELGLFKTNGVPIDNRTGVDIAITGTFGKGTADAYDIDFSKEVKVIIPNKDHKGTYDVVGLADNRYEIPKSVVIELDKVSAMSDVNISIEGMRLSCVGYVRDQGAYVAISSLGDRSEIGSTVSGLFKVELLRASDDKPLTNCTGGDIQISFDVDSLSTATKGLDFVLLNENDLRILGDCQKSATNIMGAIVFDKEKEVDEIVSIKLVSVKGVPNAGTIALHPTKQKALFTIKDSN